MNITKLGDEIMN